MTEQQKLDAAAKYVYVLLTCMEPQRHIKQAGIRRVGVDCDVNGAWKVVVEGSAGYGEFKVR